MNKTDKIYNSSNFLLSFSLFIGLGITKIINTAGTDSWICIILGTLFGLIINYILTKLPTGENKTIEVITNTFLLLLAITTITKLITSVYLDKTNSLFIMLPLIGVIIYTSTKNNYCLFKVTSILSIIHLALYLFAFLSLVSTTNIDYFMPVLINSKLKVLFGSLEYALYSTIPLIVLPNYRKQYNYKQYLLSSLFLLIIFILIIGNLGIELAKNYRYPEYMIFKNIAILDFIENIENILFFMWIINIYTLTCHCSLNIKKIINMKGLIIILIIVTLFINKILINNYKSVKFFLDYFDIILILLLFIHILGKLLYKKNHTT